MWWNSRMRIAAAGILNRGVVGTERAIATFPAVTALLNRRLIASYRIGSTKDSADETVELRFSQDLGEPGPNRYGPSQRRSRAPPDRCAWSTSPSSTTAGRRRTVDRPLILSRQTAFQSP